MSASNKAEPLLHLAYACPRAQVPSALSFRRWVSVTLAAAHKKRVALALRVVESAEAIALNQDFRERDYAPNVLSFAAGDYAVDGRIWLGDIAICRDVVLSEAQAQGKPPRAHFSHMCVHGVLHLLGFDHQDDADAARMEALEISILGSLGFANPY